MSANSRSQAAQAYIRACNREHAECAGEFVDALNNNEKVAPLGARTIPLNDTDIRCVAEAIGMLDEHSALRVLNLEENAFGLQGVQSLMEAVECNPGRIRELRLGRNGLKDQAAVAIGRTLSRAGCGLKVLDLSENGITRLGVIPIATALQSPYCDLVELSFHNNRIEADAAVFLSEAISRAPKLKHLHLGYNALRDGGAAHLARALPNAKCLTTLDLTANRIGHDGGEALARALCQPACTLQRLNLRHNALDSEAIVLFADVIAENHSLIQLFLGFMSPTPTAAITVLSALKHNNTLLLLDIYGWKLPPQHAAAVLADIQKGSSAVAAIVSDACQSIAARIDEGNVTREERGVHPLYIGPDDRDAYLATRSLRRFSRAQSRRQSRASSQVRSSSRKGSRVSVPGSRSASADPKPAKKKRGTQSSQPGGTPRSARSARSARSSAIPSPSNERQLIVRPVVHARDFSDVLAELQSISCEAGVKYIIEHLVDVMRHQVQQLRAQQRQELQAMADRIAALERRPECTCRPGEHANRFAEPVAAREASQQPQRQPSALGSGPGGPSADKRDSHLAGGAGASAAGTEYKANHVPLSAGGRTPTQADEHLASTANHAEHSIAAFVRSASAPGFSSIAHQPPSNAESVPHGSLYKRATSYISDHERAMTPLVVPSELQDGPPDVARPNDESGEPRPEENKLQRSATVTSFPPRIEPSPAPDNNPPRRKSISHTL